MLDYARPNSIQMSLRQYGVALFNPIFSPRCIQEWNAALNSSVRVGSQAGRIYLRADELHQLGIIEELFSEDFCRFINQLMPDALLYHLHLYESPGQTNSPHIHGDNGLNGWHRDDDCLYAWEENQYHFFSFFVYLTDVLENCGPFEIAPIGAHRQLRNQQPSIKVLGSAGTNFIFDRTFWHRATPNRARNNRRVIKLSFQNGYLPNDRIQLAEFDSLKASSLRKHPLIRQWLGLKSNRSNLEARFPPTDDPGVDARPVVFNSRVNVSNLQCRITRLKETRQPPRRIIHSQGSSCPKALIIGSGRRIRENYIPAIKNLNWPIEVIGLWSPNTEHARIAAENAQWPLAPKLTAELVNRADIIVVSIATKAVPSIIKKLLALCDCSRKHLVVDTPVFAGIRQSIYSRLLCRFASVVVSEDYMNYPQFEFIRHLIKAHEWGRIKSIEINQIGYLYHGLALARSFLGFPAIRDIRKQGDSVTYHFDTQQTTIIKGPYRRLNGDMTISTEGTRLHYYHSTDEESCEQNLSNARHVVTEQWRKGKFMGLIHKNADKISLQDVPRYDALTVNQSVPAEPVNVFKTMGLIEVFHSLFTHNINSPYNFQQALYDNYCSHLANRRVGALLPDYRLGMRYLEMLTVLARRTEGVSIDGHRELLPASG